MKIGDIIIGPTPDELLKTEVCHKSVETGEHEMVYQCGIVGDHTTCILSHRKWEYVTCPQCLSLRTDN